MFEWYEAVPGTSSLEQGDLLDDFPILVPQASFAQLPSQASVRTVQGTLPVERFNVVVMTQSCDLARPGTDLEVILCPRFGYREVVARDARYRDRWGTIIRGNMIGAHILRKCEIRDHEFDYQLVDLRRVFSVPIAVVRRAADSTDTRIRLLPPYREHLAAAFGRMFMRIGLPEDLPRSYPYPD